jgi:hypothetical protein
MQAFFESAEYLAGHIVQVVPPLAASESVTEPGAHFAHATVGFGENSPSLHGKHFAAPVALSVSVVDPGEHTSQSDEEPAPVSETYLPTSHLVHPLSPFLSLYWPIAHTSHTSHINCASS